MSFENPLERVSSEEVARLSNFLGNEGVLIFDNIDGEQVENREEVMAKAKELFGEGYDQVSLEAIVENIFRHEADAAAEADRLAGE